MNANRQGQEGNVNLETLWRKYGSEEFICGVLLVFSFVFMFYGLKKIFKGLNKNNLPLIYKGLFIVVLFWLLAFFFGVHSIIPFLDSFITG